MLSVAEKMFRALYLSSLLLWPALMTGQMNAPQSPAMRGRVTPVAPVAAGQNNAAVRSVSPAGGGSGITVAPAGTEANSASATATNTSSGAAAPLSSELLIGPGDLLEVSVFGADYTKQVRVNGSGEVTLPFANTVHVGGLTPPQAEAVIAKRLSDGGYFNDPKVSVLDKEFATQGVSVLGEVQKPGTYPMPGPRNLFDALSAAGGTTQRAGNTVWITHRTRPQQPEVISLSGNGGAQQNVQVYPGDTVIVSKAGIVYVVGDVHLPGGFIMENSRMTVLQAVAMAQGPNTTAALDHARLIRRSTTATTNSPQEISLSLKKIMSAKAPDVDLQAEDILFVPSSAAKTAGRRTLDAIVQTATGMAVYGRIP